ncbi:MAG TPA: hypothetical protein VFJ19_11785 [Nocardioidaceae bacterium]|nr:hypothetical protein [Nocardioidaceae bacterium]
MTTMRDEHEVDRALARLDEATANRAESAVSWLLGGPGERHDLAFLSQMNIQYLLWRKLPVNWMCEDAEHHEIAWALGDFFDAAGLQRYAAICRETRTHEILAAWHRDPEEGRQAGYDAQVASGVLPPDTKLLTFGDRMGVEEYDVHAETSRDIESAIVAGELTPGRRGFNTGVRRRMDAYIQRRPGADEATPLERVWRERSKQWMARFRGVHEPLWERALEQVHELPPVPDRVELSLTPVVALLDAVGDGLQVTAAGYLPPKLALDLDERFGWSQEYAFGKVRGEADIHPLAFVREHLQAQRLLTLRSRRLTVSAVGRRASTDPARLWLAVVGPGPRWRPGFEHDALAVIAALLLCGDRLDATALVEQATQILESKWHAADDGPVQASVTWVCWEWLRVADALGWREEHPRFGQIRLTGYGASAAACLFRVAATAPITV